MVLNKFFNKHFLLTFISFFILSSSLDTSLLDKSLVSLSKKESKIEKLILLQRQQENLKKPRNIKVNIALDGVSRKYAKELLREVSDIYKKESNISFKIVDYYGYKLPDSWNTSSEMKKVRDFSRKRSDIYLLFSNRDWREQGDLDIDSITGEAQDNLGYAWVETHNKKRDVKNLAHEITHLFNVSHSNLEDSFMHRKNPGKIYFTEDMKNTILKNKFKTWEFSSYIPR